jgi:hypothetical protein
VPAIWMEAALTSTRASPDAICTTGAAQFEVDFILGDHTALEVKATRSVSSRDPRGLTALAEEGVMKHLVLVCQEPIERSTRSRCCRGRSSWSGCGRTDLRLLL